MVLSNTQPRIVFVDADDKEGLRLAATTSGARTVLVSPRVLEKIGTTETPQSPIALLEIPTGSVPPGGRVLAGWGVADPGNLGALVRIAAAFGYAFLAGPASADLWSPKVLRAGAGAHFRTRVSAARSLDEIAAGRTVAVMVVQGGAPPGHLPEDVALVVGSEAHGLPEDVVEAATIAISIPMSGGTESLNAAAAGAIAAYLGAGTSGTNLPAA
jgi:TrmH family RNA methyltransferase